MGGGGGGGIGGAIGSIGNTIGDVVKQGSSILPITGGIAGGVAGLPGMIGGAVGGEYARNQLQGGGPDVPQPPTPDDRMRQIKDAQFKQARDFRANLPGFQKEQLDQFRNQRMRDLGQEAKDTDLSLQRRGLSYGGISEGAHAKNVSRAAGDVGKARKDINISSEEMANQLEADALNSGILMQKTQQSIQDTIYNQALSEYKNRSAGMGSLLGGIGTGVGLGMGSKK